MKLTMNNKSVSGASHAGIALAALIAVAAGGCAMQDQDGVARQNAGIATEIRNLQDSEASSGARLDALDQEISRISGEVQDVIGGYRTDISALEKRIATLESRIAAVDAARESDKKEIIDRLSETMANLMNRKIASTTERSVGASSHVPGKTEHVVKERETLSSIARQYKTTVGALVSANSLKNADDIRVGTKLVIPR